MDCNCGTTVVSTIEPSACRSTTTGMSRTMSKNCTGSMNECTVGTCLCVTTGTRSVCRRTEQRKMRFACGHTESDGWWWWWREGGGRVMVVCVVEWWWWWWWCRSCNNERVSGDTHACMQLIKRAGASAPTPSAGLTSRQRTYALSLRRQVPGVPKCKNLAQLQFEEKDCEARQPHPPLLRRKGGAIFYHSQQEVKTNWETVWKKEWYSSGASRHRLEAPPLNPWDNPKSHKLH